MMFGHLILVLISLKKPSLSRFFIYYECLWSIVYLTLPDGCHEAQTQRLNLTTSLYVMFMSFNYISGLVPILALRLYNDLVVSKLIYAEEITKEVIQYSIQIIVVAILYHTIMHLLISWIGEVYVKSEVSRVNNELILDNLDDGLIIIEEESGELVFANKQAKRFNINLNLKFFTIDL